MGAALAAGVSLAVRGGDATAASSDKKTQGGAQLPAGANAAEVYGKLTQEVEALSRQAMQNSSPAEQARIFGEIEGKFVAFRERWPNTPEANDAAFQLGVMNFGMQKHAQASQFLKEFLGKSKGAERDQLAFAHYYLAEAYKAQGKYDVAEGEYKVILAQYSDVNKDLTDAVRGNLSGLSAERQLAVGGEPLAFSVKSIDGKTLSPAAYKGKVLLIDFWATWCGPCVAEMPNVKQVYAKYHPKGFEIVGISLDKSRDRLDQYIQQNQIPWPQYFDGKWWNNDVAVRYGIKSIPATFLVDKKGKIRYKSLRGPQLEKAVAELLEEKV
jgi:thiol-disulfide isomerase/thioredoxin